MVLRLLLLVLLMSYECVAKPKCVGKCICDSYRNLRRLKCSNQNLVNMLSDIPPTVQVLDFSYNRIKFISDRELNSFGLNSMKVFNISHNSVGHIHLNGFKGMTTIRIVDLSYNSLEYILRNWFDDLPNLKELYLSNNNFASLSDGPLIESSSLEKLDLSYSRIPHIKKDAFCKLPNLQKINLNGNSLIQLNTATLSTLKNLRSLSLENNPLNCDKTRTNLKKHLQELQASYADSCDPNANVEKFQRIVEPNRDLGDVNTWTLDEETENGVSVTYNCTKLEGNEERKELLVRIIELSPVMAVLTPFVVGTAIGLILGCGVRGRKPRLPTRRRRKRFPSVRNNADNYPLVMNSEHVWESTPVPQRRNFQVNSL